MKTTEHQLIEAWTHSQKGIEFKTPFARWLRTHAGCYKAACEQYLLQERMTLMRQSVNYS